MTGPRRRDDSSMADAGRDRVGPNAITNTKRALQVSVRAMSPPQAWKINEGHRETDRKRLFPASAREHSYASFGVARRSLGEGGRVAEREPAEHHARPPAVESAHGDDLFQCLNLPSPEPRSLIPEA